MIWLGLVAAGVFPGRFVEEVLPSAKSTLIEAAIVFPYLTPEDRAIEEVIAASLLEGTADYTKEQMRESSVYIGEPLKCVATPDCIRITIGTRRDDWQTGLRILKSILRSPELSDESIEKAKSTLPFLNRNPWRSAVDPMPLSYEKVRKRDIRDFMRRNFVPDGVSIVVAGGFAPGEPRAFWLDAVSDWDASQRLRFKADRRPEFITRRPEVPVSILRWNGPEFAPQSVRIAAPLVAAYALGTGKDSSGFRVLREKERLSYRQEFVVAPSGEGFRLELITAFRPREDEANLPDRLKADMIADIETWTEATRFRALQMANSSMLLHAFPVPFDFVPDGALAGEDRFFLEAYWPMKTGEPWNTREMLKAMEGVTLEQMKDSARDLFSKGTVAQSQ